MTIPARVGRVLDNVVAPASLAAAGDLGMWTVVGGHIMIMRLGVLVTAAQTGAAPMIRFDLRLVYGSDEHRWNGVGGSMRFPSGGVPVGAMVWTPARAQIAAGWQVILAVETPGGAGMGIPFIEYEVLPDNFENLRASVTPRHIQGQTFPYTGPWWDSEPTALARESPKEAPSVPPPSPRVLEPSRPWLLGQTAEDEPAWVHAALRAQLETQRR